MKLLDQASRLAAMKKYDAAVTCLDQEIKNCQKNKDQYGLVQAKRQKANLLLELYKYQELYEISEWLRDNDQILLRHHLNKMAIALENMNRGQEAKQYYDQIITLIESEIEEDPTKVSSYLFKANILDKVKRFEDAIESYQQAINFETDRDKLSKISNNIGLIYERWADNSSKNAEFNYDLYRKALYYYRKTMKEKNVDAKDEDSKDIQRIAKKCEGNIPNTFDLQLWKELMSILDRCSYAYYEQYSEDRKEIVAFIMLGKKSLTDYFKYYSYNSLYKFRCEDDLYAPLDCMGVAVALLSVYRIEVSLYKKWINNQPSSIHKYLEKFLLERYIVRDLDERTVEGIVFESKEEVHRARETINQLQMILENGRVDSESGAKELLLKLQEGNFPEKLVEKHIADIEKRIKDFDEQKRSVDGVVYSSIEEAAKVATEIMQFDKVLSDKDLSTVKNIEKILIFFEGMSFQTDAVNNRINSIKERKIQIERQQRTVDGILYENEELAYQATKELQEIDMVIKQGDMSSVVGVDTIIKQIASMEFQTLGAHKRITAFESEIRNLRRQHLDKFGPSIKKIKEYQDKTGGCFSQIMKFIILLLIAGAVVNWFGIWGLVLIPIYIIGIISDWRESRKLLKEVTCNGKYEFKEIYQQYIQKEY